MGAAPFSRTKSARRPLVRGVVTYLGLPHRQTAAVFRHVFPAESSGAGIDALPGPAESPGLDLENCRAGLQYRGRCLFNSLDHPLSTAGLKSVIGCSGYFEGNTQLRRERHLHSRYLTVCQCFDFRTVDRG